jgi:hypothetical protein
MALAEVEFLGMARICACTCCIAKGQANKAKRREVRIVFPLTPVAIVFIRVRVKK